MRKKHLFLLFFTPTLLVALAANFCFAQQDPFAGPPPICPRWAFEPWVWEDYVNTKDEIKMLVEAYRHEDRDIPVGAVIIDSPWETCYNNFEWWDVKYPNPQQMIDGFHSDGIKVIMWITGFINGHEDADDDSPDKICDDYEFVKSEGYTVNDGQDFEWWKGKGVHIDFTNQNATQWWHQQMDKVLDIKIDGWKVDRSADADYLIGGGLDTELGSLKPSIFKKYYYADLYDYSKGKSQEAITVARAYSHQGGKGASISKSPISWQGDFCGDFQGLKKQMKYVYKSAQDGYSAPGVEVGGYYLSDNGDCDGGSISKESLIRYTQFGAMTPLMENGGKDKNHEPWEWDDSSRETPQNDGETVDIYLYYATLHSELVPYIFSYDVESQIYYFMEKKYKSILRDPDPLKMQHKLGEEIFVSLLTDGTGLKEQVCFPRGTRWIDYWAEKKGETKVYYGGTCEKDYNVSIPVGEPELKPFPIFIKVGAIIPMNVKNNITGHGFEESESYSSDGKITLNIYPGGQSNFTFHYPTGDGTSCSDIKIEVNEAQGNIHIYEIPLNERDSNDSGEPICSEIKDSYEYIIRVKSFKEPTSVSATGAEDGFTWEYKDQDDLIIIDAKGKNFTMTIEGLEGYGPTTSDLIANLIVNDLGNANDWSIQSDLKIGDRQYGDRDYHFVEVPPIIAGADWIRTANDSKLYSGDPIATFTVIQLSEVYVAHDDRITSKPSWLSDWQDTGENMTNSEPQTFSLYKKTYGGGLEVSLGPNTEDGNPAYGMYTVIAMPVMPQGLRYTSVTPCRIVDTRISQGGAGPIIGGTQRNFSAAGICGVPSGPAKAVMINITAVSATGTGHLRAFAYPESKPFAATLSFGAVPQLGQGIANAAVIPICDNDIQSCSFDLSIWVSRTTDVVVDVMGYFALPETP